MKTIDTSHRLETRKEQLDLPAPKVLLALEQGKKSVSDILSLTEAEQNLIDLAKFFGLSENKIFELITRDRQVGRTSVFEKVQGGKFKQAANDERYAKAG